MNRPSRIQLLLSIAVLALLAFGLVACGGDDDGGSDAPAETATSGAEATIDAWFEAARLGETADKCALESERFQVQQYGSAGKACLKDAANLNPQPVWAEKVVIVDLQESGGSVSGTVQPNAGTDDTATISLVEEGDGWVIDTFY